MTAPRTRPRLIAAIRRHRRAQKALAGFYIGHGFVPSDELAQAEAAAAAAARDLPPWLARRM